MSQSLTNILIHIVFSTKNRKPIIRTEINQNLYRYIVGIASSHNSTVYEIGGTEDHVHLLLTLPKTLQLSKLVAELKKGSSKWVKTNWNQYKEFAWQNGYGAFSIGQSKAATLKNYIKNQQKHHKKISFKDEYRLLLKKYCVNFNEKYVWN